MFIVLGGIFNLSLYILCFENHLSKYAASL